MRRRFGRSRAKALRALSDADLLAHARLALDDGRRRDAERAVAILAAGYRTPVRARITLRAGAAQADELADRALEASAIRGIGDSGSESFRAALHETTDELLREHETPPVPGLARIGDDEVAMLLAAFIAESELGGQPDPTEFVHRAGADGEQLAELLDAHLRGAQRRPAAVDARSAALAARVCRAGAHEPAPGGEQR